MKRKIFHIFKILFTLTILFLVFKDINFNEVVHAAKNINIFIIIIAFSLFYISKFLSALKITYILQNYQHLLYITKLNFIAIFLNNFVPGSITTDVYKGYKLKDAYKPGEIAFGLIGDRLSGLIILGLMFCFSGLFFIDFLRENFTLDKNYIALGFASLILFVFLAYIIGKKLLKKDKIIEFKKLISELSLKKILIIFFLTTLIRILVPVMFFLELYAIDYNLASIPFYYIIFITTITEIIGIIPLTVKGYGVRETIWLGLLIPFGVNIETIALLSILIILNDIIASSIGGFLYLKNK